MGTRTCTTPPSRDAEVRSGPGQTTRRVAARVAVRRVGPGLARLLLALALALPAGLLGEGARPALAAAGDLDPTFDGDGIVVSSLAAAGGGVTGGAVVAVQPDGKIVAAGQPNGLNPNGPGVAVARFGPDGRLDPSFGAGGTVQADVGQIQLAPVSVVTLQADGKIIVAGGAHNPNSNAQDFALVRYTPDGRLDTGFGSGGKVFTDLGPPFFTANGAVAVQADGKIVAGSFRLKCVIVGACSPLLVLARYNPDGSLDTGFGTGGKASPDLSVGPVFQMVVQADGKIVVAGMGGQSGVQGSLARITSDGAADESFGSAGQVLTGAASGLALQADGKLVVAGSSTVATRYMLARYTPSGTPDPTFGVDGFVTAFLGEPASIPNVSSVVVQADGKVVVAGGGSSVDGGPSSGFVLRRYTPSGSPDPTFGNGGRVSTTSPAGTLTNAKALALQADGKLVAVGGIATSSAEYFALARYQTGGVGGLAFGISPLPSSIGLGWAPGTGQTGYLLARLPEAAWPLAASATTFTDPAPVRGAGLDCYQLFPLAGSSALAASDALCALLGVRSQIGPPPGFALRLDESTTARLTWGSSGDQLGYVLLALPQGGTPRTLGLLPSARWATDQTGGVPTCYVLYAVYAAGLGNTDLACAVPGRASFGASGQAAQGAAATPQAARTVAAPVTEPQLAPQLREGQTQVEQEAGKLRRKGR